MIETRSKQKTKDNKEKSNNSHKREMFKNNDLKEPNKMIHRFLDALHQSSRSVG
jgi:hypothetical protein